MKFILFLSAWLGLVSLTQFSPIPKETAILSGTVTGSDGETLIGAAVQVFQNKLLIQGTRTDVNGKYTIQLEPGIYQLECAYTGYSTYKVSDIKIESGKITTLDFRLEAGTNLSEVVVISKKQTGRSESKVSALKAAPAADKAGKKASDSKTRSKGETSATYDRKAKEAAPKPESTKTAADDLNPYRGNLDKTLKLSYDTGKPVSKDELGRIAATPAAAPTEDGVVNIKGARKDGIDYYIDGIRISDDKKMPVKDLEDERKPTEEIGEALALSIEEKIEPGEIATPAPKAGLLTAGEWNDLHNWNKHWLDLIGDGEIDQYQVMYNFFPKFRYTVMLTNEQDFPVADAVIKLLSGNGETLWESRTDNTGKAECWAGMFDNNKPENIRVEAWVDGQMHDLGQPKAAKDGINRYKINVECKAPKNVDIVWAVDATGSMGDEIEYLKTELLDVIGRAKANNPELAFRMGTVFYRDQGDEYVTKSSPLTADIAQTVGFIRQQFAGGGGDYPEAVHSALDEAMFKHDWSENAIARICFLVLDASPHQDPAVNQSLQRSIREAARRGIRIVPVAASGVQKDTEFLLKFFGLATNGTYVFLTDHSGIGGKHLEPTTDEYTVEPLNDLLVRVITEYTTIKTCEGQSTIRFEEPIVQQQQQTPNWEAHYFPNPAALQFTLDLPFDVQSVTIYDAEGQAVRKIEKPLAGPNTMLVSDLSEGFYTIRILKDGRMQSGKLMVVRS